jgi:hypothetical protein
VNSGQPDAPTPFIRDAYFPHINDLIDPDDPSLGKMPLADLEPLGLCCLNTGQSAQYWTRKQCDDLDLAFEAVFYPSESNASFDCAERKRKGACCWHDRATAPRNSCQENVTEEECDARLDGTGQGKIWRESARCDAMSCVGSNPFVRGACCRTGQTPGNDCNVNVDEATCKDIGGNQEENFYAYHFGFACDLVRATVGGCEPLQGACCFGTRCAKTTLEACAEGAGRFQGANTTCSQTECTGVDPLEGCRTSQESRLPDGLDGPMLPWSPDLCHPAAFVMGQHPVTFNSPFRGDFDIVSSHRIRAKHILEHFINVNTPDVCRHHFGGIGGKENGDVVAIFCSQPSGHTNSRSLQYTECGIMMSDKDRPEIGLRKGDCAFVGSYAAPYWTEAELSSDEITCGGVE